ncbi:MAG: hypothetical protein KDG50_07215 [Chromatiales bacterium]|nr:hypothetical protein [Chromatiales bacterium]
MRPLISGFVLILATAAIAPLAWAQSRGAFELDAPSHGSDKFEDPEPWRERTPGVMPEAPREENLVEIVPLENDPDFRYFVDLASLSLDSDYVYRLTLVSRSRSGFDNAEYLGIRCSSSEMREYGWLKRSGQWYERANSEWRRPLSNAYGRKALIADGLLCFRSQPRRIEQARHSLRSDSGRIPREPANTKLFDW